MRCDVLFPFFNFHFLLLQQFESRAVEAVLDHLWTIDKMKSEKCVNNSKVSQQWRFKLKSITFFFNVRIFPFIKCAHLEENARKVVYLKLSILDRCFAHHFQNKNTNKAQTMHRLSVVNLNFELWHCCFDTYITTISLDKICFS